MDQATQLAEQLKSNTNVTVTLESTTTKFYVPKVLLCKASPYFDRALNNGCQETPTQTLALPGCDTDTLKFFLFWLFHGRLPGVQEDWPQRRERNTLIRLWSFGDAYLMPKLQNEVMRALYKNYHSRQLKINEVRLVFELTSADSPIRRAVVKLVAQKFYFSGNITQKEADEYGTIPGLLFELASTMARARPMSRNATYDPWDSEELMVPE